MADIVQKHLEAMTIEFESMVFTKLFTSDKIKEIRMKRTDFEYKVYGPHKSKQDICEYIEYERKLLKCIRLGREKHRIFEKKDAIEFRIIKRIQDLYEILIQYYSEDLVNYLDYYKFLKEINYVNATKNLVNKMIQAHPNDERVWCLATKWYAINCNDYSTAREIILKGLSIHKTSQVLYKEAIEMELLNLVGKLQQKSGSTCQNEEDEEILKKRRLTKDRINVHLNFALKHVDSCEFYIEILENFENYNFTIELQHAVIKHLLEKCGNVELVWEVLVKRELKGLYYETDPNFNKNERTTKKGWLMSALKKYEEGIAKVSADRKEKMWSLYLEFLLNLNCDDFGVSDEFRLKILREAFKKASKEGYMREKYYMNWLKFVESDREGLKIAKDGTINNPKSVFLWKALIDYLVMTDDDKEILKAFKDAREKLKENSLPIWNALIRYLLLKLKNDEEIKAVFMDGIKESPEVSESLKCQFLEWLTMTENIEAARKLYNEIARMKPYSIKIHEKMALLETLQFNVNTGFIKNVHELAVEQFGGEDVDVWINYCQFYVNFSKKDAKEQLQKIYENAIKMLPSLLHDEFIQRFMTCKETLLKRE